MSQPFIFISTFRLKQGKLEAFQERCQGLIEFVESNEPRIIAFNLYASTDGAEVSNVQVHPDADSLVSHMQLLRERISGAGGEEGSIDVTTSSQIYGVPNPAVLEMIEEFDPGVRLASSLLRSPGSPVARQARRTARRDALPAFVGLTRKPRRPATVSLPPWTSRRAAHGECC